MNLIAVLANLLRIPVNQLPPPPPWNEAREEQISHAAETFDPETGRSQPLQRRRR